MMKVKRTQTRKQNKNNAPTHCFLLHAHTGDTCRKLNQIILAYIWY